jgi:hypothetical protein
MACACSTQENHNPNRTLQEHVAILDEDSGITERERGRERRGEEERG